MRRRLSLVNQLTMRGGGEDPKRIGGAIVVSFIISMGM